MAPLCMCLLSLAEYVLYSPSFCCPFSPDIFVPPDAGLLAVDVSKVTLPAWPGQGMVATWLSSGLLVPLVSLSVLGCYFAFTVIRIFVMYLFVKLGSLESLLYIYVFCGSVGDYCDAITCDNKSTHIACMFRRARNVWWAPSDRFYAEFGRNAEICIVPIRGRYKWYQSMVFRYPAGPLCL